MDGINDKENLVLLTAREHFLVHWLLAEIHNTSGLWYAFNKMCLVAKTTRGRILPSSRIIEYVKTKTLPYKKRKRSEKELNHLRNNFRGRKHTEISKIKASISCKNAWTPKMRETKGLLTTQLWIEGKLNNDNNKKPINQYDLNGNFIREWNSTKDAANELSILDSSINRCLKGKYKRAGNYIFKYKII
jgi:hypothetical protein